MSTYYYIICKDHRAITEAVSKTPGGHSALGESAKTLLPFIVKHTGCDISIISEHDEECEIYRELLTKSKV